MLSIQCEMKRKQTVRRRHTYSGSTCVESLQQRLEESCPYFESHLGQASRLSNINGIAPQSNFVVAWLACRPATRRLGEIGYHICVTSVKTQLRQYDQW